MNSNKFSIDSAKKLALLRGGRCLSDKYVNNRTKMLWECSQGHQWQAVWGSINNLGTWCPDCAGKKKLTIAIAHGVAKVKGGKCLSNEYVNGATKMLWECDKSHQWTASFDSIRRHWCPECSRNKKPSLVEITKIAEARNGKCLSTKYVNCETKMLWECDKGHRWYSNLKQIKYNNTWCPQCANTKKASNDSAKLTIKHAQELAESKKGKCLSTEYVNCETKMLWECDKGHQWNARYANIKYRNTWCPYCAGNMKLSLQDAQNFVETKGGKCLSIKYSNNDSKMLWECGNGHQWNASFGSLKIDGNWCPQCAKSKNNGY